MPQVPIMPAQSQRPATVPGAAIAAAARSQVTPGAVRSATPTGQPQAWEQAGISPDTMLAAVDQAHANPSSIRADHPAFPHLQPYMQDGQFDAAGARAALGLPDPMAQAQAGYARKAMKPLPAPNPAGVYGG